MCLSDAIDAASKPGSDAFNITIAEAEMLERELGKTWLADRVTYLLIGSPIDWKAKCEALERENKETQVAIYQEVVKMFPHVFHDYNASQMVTFLLASYQNLQFRADATADALTKLVQLRAADQQKIEQLEEAQAAAEKLKKDGWEKW